MNRLEGESGHNYCDLAIKPHQSLVNADLQSSPRRPLERERERNRNREAEEREMKMRKWNERGE